MVGISGHEPFVADVSASCATLHPDTLCNADPLVHRDSNESRTWQRRTGRFLVPVLYLHPAFQAFHTFQDVQLIRILSCLEPTVCSNPLFRTSLRS